jgi:anti-sigma regulatory factor (Ser/Thr protein kinase)
VPLSRPGLHLRASPRAVAEARRWVADLCAEIDRRELAECAELGVSELVTNALLHADPPVRVRVRGTRRHPRIEVIDGSPSPPKPPEPTTSEDSFLSTFGRGLGIVASVAVAWGAAIESHGKVVWFEPAPELRADQAEGLIDTIQAEEPDLPLEGTIEVDLMGIDVDLFSSLEQQYSELRRELRLLSLAHEDTYPLAKDLSASFAAFEAQFPIGMNSATVRECAGHDTHVDMTVRMRPEAAPILSTMLEMFDLADAFCRGERLLSLQRTPRQREFHLWLLGEIIAQLGGAPSRPWRGSTVSDDTTQHVP